MNWNLRVENAGLHEVVRTALGVAKPPFTRIGSTIASVFMIPQPWIGMILWIGLAVDSLRHAAFGLLGLGVGDLVGRVLDIRGKPALGGGVRANALLASVGVSWLTTASHTSLPIELTVAILAAATTALLTAALMRALADTILPPLVLGFSLVSGTIFLLFPIWKAGALASTAAWPTALSAGSWLQTIIRSLGSLLFSSTLEVGVLVALALLLWSRTMFLAGMIGWLTGAFFTLGFRHLSVPFYWQPASYNFFITGMALGAAFFLPGWPSLGVAASGGASAAIFALVLQRVAPNWAFLPVSAVLAIWVGMLAFTLTDNRLLVRRNLRQDIPPEEAWLREINWMHRFGDHEPLLVVPIAGIAKVTQGFNGKLSHRGPWCHAIDLQRPLEANHDGVASIWEVAVTAPAAGTVERVRDGIADNPIGISNYAENWGNYVLIRLDQGSFALLAHLRQNSIQVHPGMRVEIGSYLGAAGNSGRSPVPHLHLQVQRSPILGAPTVPFRLANYQSTTSPGTELDHWHAAAVPPENTTIAASWPNPFVHDLLASLAPGTALWTVDAKGHIPRAFRPPQAGVAPIQIITSLDEAGRHLFTTPRNGSLVSVLDPDAWRVQEVQGHASPFLELLAIASPSIPYAAKAGLFWQDPAPVTPRITQSPALSLLPYIKRPLLEFRTVCTGEPEPDIGQLTIETTPVRQKPFLPIKITCQFQRLRGPVSIKATFETGSLVYSQLSFQPGLPVSDNPL